MIEHNELLLQIARCELATGGRARSDSSHDCHEIVQLQTADLFQLPEPWTGQMEKAPILFISSNPSINESERYPETNWCDEQVVDFFRNRFAVPDGPAAGLKALLNDGMRTDVVHYWAHARARSSEILQVGKNNVRPGLDFALTEVVHCKSRSEIGVAKARKCCVDRYLRPILAIAAAPVLVIYGSPAAKTFREEFKIEILSAALGKCTINEKIRLIAFLPGPAAFHGPKTLLEALGMAGLNQLREHLRTARNFKNDIG
jgi:hypothetical protein